MQFCVDISLQRTNHHLDEKADGMLEGKTMMMKIHSINDVTFDSFLLATVDVVYRLDENNFFFLYQFGALKMCRFAIKVSILHFVGEKLAQAVKLPGRPKTVLRVCRRKSAVSAFDVQHSIS